MPIKRSSLERKWYYRLAKVFFLILPLLLLLLLLPGILSGKKVLVCSFVPANFSSIPPEYIVFVVVAFILYYVLLHWIWKGILYVAFGGVEEDTSGEGNNKVLAALVKPKPQPQMKKEGQIVWVIVMIVILAIGFLASMGYIELPKINIDSLNSNNTTTGVTPNSCPATSAQTSTPCGSAQGGGVVVSGVIVYDYCKCPSDTTYSGTTDVVTPGGPYKICTCN